MEISPPIQLVSHRSNQREALHHSLQDRPPIERVQQAFLVMAPDRVQLALSASINRSQAAVSTLLAQFKNA